MRITCFSSAIDRADGLGFDFMQHLDRIAGTLTTEHPTSTHGQPVLVSRCTGIAYRPADIDGILSALRATDEEIEVIRAAGWRIQGTKD